MVYFGVGEGEKGSNESRDSKELEIAKLFT